MHDESVTDREGQAAKELYGTEGARLWRAVLAYTGDREVANYSVAEAFAHVLARTGRTRRPAQAVWRAAFRFADAEMTERSRFAGVDPPEGVEAVLDEGGLRDPSGLLLMALRRLAPMQRGALVLRHYAGRSTWSAANILGTSVALMPLHLTRGKRRLRHLLGGKRDLKGRFDALGRVSSPDLWPDVLRRNPEDPPLAHGWGPVGKALLAAAMAAGAVALVWVLAGRA